MDLAARVFEFNGGSPVVISGFDGSGNGGFKGTYIPAIHHL